jgi:hypothetical protein
MEYVQAAGKGIVQLPSAVKSAVDNKRVTQGWAGAGGAGVILAARDWVAAHPAETIAIALAGLVAIGGVLYAVEHIHKSQQEAPIPGINPVPVAA